MGVTKLLIFTSTLKMPFVASLYKENSLISYFTRVLPDQKY